MYSRGCARTWMPRRRKGWREPPSSPLKNSSPRREFADSVFYHESAEACMRGAFFDLGKLFSYLSPEARVPARHPLGEALRKRRTSLDRSGAIVERIAVAGVLRHPIGTTADGTIGLQSVVPLVRGTFARRPGLGPDHVYEEPGPAAERVFAKFMTKLLNHPQVKPLLSDEHFSVDGTLIEAWASQKSFRPKDGS